MTDKLNALAFGGAAAIVAALVMLIFGILGNVGIYTGAVSMMSEWHMFFSLTRLGVLAGMAEAAISTFVFVYLFGVIYNNIK